jgi:hypothetical protein
VIALMGGRFQVGQSATARPETLSLQVGPREPWLAEGVDG